MSTFAQAVQLNSFASGASVSGSVPAADDVYSHTASPAVPTRSTTKSIKSVVVKPQQGENDASGGAGKGQGCASFSGGNTVEVVASSASRRVSDGASKAATAEALHYVLLSKEAREDHTQRSTSGQAAASGADVGQTSLCPGQRTTLARRLAHSQQLVSSVDPLSHLGAEPSVVGLPTTDSSTGAALGGELNLEGLSPAEMQHINLAMILLREKNPTHRVLFALQREVGRQLKPIVDLQEASRTSTLAEHREDDPLAPYRRYLKPEDGGIA